MLVFSPDIINHLWFTGFKTPTNQPVRLILTRFEKTVVPFITPKQSYHAPIAVASWSFPCTRQTATSSDVAFRPGATIRHCRTTDFYVTIGQCVVSDRNLACAVLIRRKTFRRWSLFFLLPSFPLAHHCGAFIRLTCIPPSQCIHSFTHSHFFA